MNATPNPQELNQEIIDHLMHPKNYGQIDPANGVGMGYDAKTQEFVIFYLHVSEEKIEDLGYATNGCQDTVILGSMFGEMIKGDSVANANRSCELMRQQISSAPAKQQACADMVLTAYEIALQNYADGHVEAMSKRAIDASCEIQKEQT